MATKRIVGAISIVSLLLSIAAASAASDSPGYRMVGTVPAPDGAFGNAVIDLQTRQMLIAQQGGVTAFDLDLQVVKPGFAVIPDATSVSALGASGLVAATARMGSVTMFEGRTGKSIASLKTGAQPQGAFFEAKSGLLVVLDTGAADASVIDPTKHAATGIIALGGKPSAASTGDAEGTVYAGMADGKEIVALDPVSRTVARHITVAGCTGFTGLAHADESDALIAACGNGVVKLLEAKSGAELGSIQVGKSPGVVMFDRDRHGVIVPGALGSLSAISLAADGSGKLVQTLQIPNGVRSGAVDTVTGRIFLLVPGSGPGGSRILVVDPA